jgi:signal transduction histidine kinase
MNSEKQCSDQWRPIAFRQVSRLLAVLAIPVWILALGTIRVAHPLVFDVTLCCLLGVFVAVAMLAGDLRRYRVLATVQFGTLLAGCLILIAKYGLLPGVAVALASTIVWVAVFLENRAGWAAIAVTTLLLLATGAAARAGLLHPADPRSTLDWSRMATWLRFSATYFLVTCAVSSTVAALIHRLERGLVAEREAREAAQRALEAREEFLAVAAHELRTPLTSLMLVVQRASRRAKQGLPGEAEQARIERMLAIAERQTVSISLLVDRLLDVSSLAGGSFQLVLSEVDLADAVRTSVAHLSDPLRASGSQLTVDAHGPIVGHWDRSRVEQVVTNLLSNAIKYGEGRPIEISVAAGDDVARLVVRDHGMGVSPEEQARIFGPFERAASPRHYGGLGLGLHIVQQVVERLGGRVECVSTLHEGSTFTVTLPLARASATAQRDRDMAAVPGKDDLGANGGAFLEKQPSH